MSMRPDSPSDTERAKKLTDALLKALDSFSEKSMAKGEPVMVNVVMSALVDLVAAVIEVNEDRERWGAATTAFVYNLTGEMSHRIESDRRPPIDVEALH